MPPVLYADTSANPIADWLSRQSFSRLVVIIDATVWLLHGNRLSAILPPDSLIITIPPGEPNKTLQTCETVWGQLFDNAIDRKALVLAIGGGMTTDLAAFAAGCWMRGVRFALVPTTLLAMIDAAIGGKTGVDFRNGKNLIGLFNQPEAVFVDDKFLNTLPANELRGGFAEALKHALVYDGDYWQTLNKSSLSYQNWSLVIRRSIEIKSEIVKQDPKEAGLRKILNFGHTIGHAIESALLAANRPILHGEAVALGILAESRLSIQFAGLSEGDFNEIKTSLEKYAFSLSVPHLSADEAARFLSLDKKNADGELRFSLLREIGSCIHDAPVSLEAAVEAMRQTGICR